jgi:hypothetical protein
MTYAAYEIGIQSSLVTEEIIWLLSECSVRLLLSNKNVSWGNWLTWVLYVSDWYSLYREEPGAHESPIRLTSAMNFLLEIGWQADKEDAVFPGMGTWSSGE